MLRRLAEHQPETFAFTAANQAWADAQMTKFPEGRQASAIIPLLWRAQEQEGWLSRPAIEHVADMLGLAYIRALEVATFYFMFQLHPIGRIAHVQVCGTLSCMICGSEDLMAACQEKIAPEQHALSQDGNFSWEEVECLGACANAPMAQIGKDYYEDLTPEKLGGILDELAAGRVPMPGPQNGRYASEPAAGLTSLTGYETDRMEHNASVALALAIGDTVKRIDGTEVPLETPWQGVDVHRPETPPPTDSEEISEHEPRPGAGHTVSEKGITTQEAEATERGHPETEPDADAAPSDSDAGIRPEGLQEPRGGEPDDLKRIKGVGPKVEELLHELGFYHYDQIAAWTPTEAAWVDEHLEGFKGRVSRDDWVAQAKHLSGGGT